MPLAHGDVEIPQTRQARGQFGQLVIVRREQSLCANLVVQKFDDGPRQAEAVERARAAADFVQDHQAARRGVVQYVRRLAHLDHEGGLAARKVVARADAREDAVHEVDARRRRRDERTGVSQQREQRDLPDVGALARHVRPGDEHDLGEVIFPLPF